MHYPLSFRLFATKSQINTPYIVTLCNNLYMNVCRRDITKHLHNTCNKLTILLHYTLNISKENYAAFYTKKFKTKIKKKSFLLLAKVTCSVLLNMSLHFSRCTATYMRICKKLFFVVRLFIWYIKYLYTCDRIINLLMNRVIL